MNQDLIVLSPVQTQNKRTIAIPITEQKDNPCPKALAIYLYGPTTEGDT